MSDNSNVMEYDSVRRRRMVKEIARKIAADLVSLAGYGKEQPACDHVLTMRRLVDTIIQLERFNFRNLIELLSDYGLTAFSSPKIIRKVGDEMFAGDVNWRCVVTLYAFAFWWICEIKRLSKTPDQQQKPVDFWSYTYTDVIEVCVVDRFGQWIFENGGWVSHTFIHV